ncbi:hypothetical protein BC829DRAFT_396814, partial [Chytridium lagenaria]
MEVDEIPPSGGLQVGSHDNDAWTTEFSINISPNIAAFMAAISTEGAHNSLKQEELTILKNAAGVDMAVAFNGSRRRPQDQETNRMQGHKLLALLSNLLLRPCLTHLIWRCFRPVLVDLVGRWTDMSALSLSNIACPIHGHACVEHALERRKPLTILFTNALKEDSTLAKPKKASKISP